MPTRAPRPCTWPSGCRELTSGGRCAKHTTRNRRAPVAFYSTAAWRRFRRAFLDANPLCIECAVPTPATDVDHIIPLAKGGARLDYTNCRALCHSHHSRHTAIESSGWREGR